MTEPDPQRRQRLPRAQRRALLLAAATEVFARQGYHDASMDAVAKAAGVTKPVLYQHFDSKLELLRAVIVGASQDLRDRVSASMSSTDEGVHPFVGAIDALFAFAASENHAFELIFEAELPQDPVVKEAILGNTQEIALEAGPVIARSSGLDDVRAAQLAWSLIGMGTFAVRHWKRSGSLLPVDEAAKLIADLTLSGLGQWPPRG